MARPEIQRGLDALAARREAEVLPIVAAAAAHAPGDAPLHHILGLLHRGTGDLAAAIAAFDTALALTPGSARLVHARARAALEAGLPSAHWFERARALAPGDGDAVLGHAAALLADGDPDAADAELAAMLRAHPGWLPGHEALLRLRFAADGALRLDELDTAIAGAPRDHRLHAMKVMALHRGGRDDAALTALGEARAVLGDAPLRALTAVLTTEQGRLADADAAFAQLDPNADPDLAIHWLRHLLRRGEPERAAAFAEALPADRAVSAEPYLTLARRLLGDPRAEVDRYVRVIDFGADWLPLADLGAVLRPLHRTRGQPLDQSVRGGTQTDGPLLSRIDPALRTIAARFLAEVAAYRAALPADPAHPFVARAPLRPRFAGSWSVRLAGGGYHEPHIHGEGWLSSVFYVSLPDGDPGALTLGEPQASLGLDLPPQRVVEPRPGRLVLVPSTMWHGTRPFGAGERLTIAFDIA